MKKQNLLLIITLSVAVVIFTQKLRTRSSSPQVPLATVEVPRALSQQGLQSPGRLDEDKPYLPNPKLTAGSVFQEATRQEICVPGYAKRVRHVLPEVKAEVYRSYGIRHHKLGDYEMDHLISLELGGDNQPTNLWPEPYHGQWNARDKDKLENELHRRVCSGAMPLQQAQREIAIDWVAAYRKYLEGR